VYQRLAVSTDRIVGFHRPTAHGAHHLGALDVAHAAIMLEHDVLAGFDRDATDHASG